MRARPSKFPPPVAAPPLFAPSVSHDHALRHHLSSCRLRQRGYSHDVGVFLRGWEIPRRSTWADQAFRPFKACWDGGLGFCAFWRGLHSLPMLELLTAPQLSRPPLRSRRSFPVGQAIASKRAPTHLSGHKLQTPKPADKLLKCRRPRRHRPAVERQTGF